MEEKGEFEQRPEVKPADQVPLPQKKANPITGILCVIFALVALGLGGYLLYDKVFRAWGGAINCKITPEVAQGVNYEETLLKVKAITGDLWDVLVDYDNNAGGIYVVDRGIDKNQVHYEFEKGYTTSLDYVSGLGIRRSGHASTNEFQRNSAFSKAVEGVLTKHGLTDHKTFDSDYLASTDTYSGTDGSICEAVYNSDDFSITCSNTGWLTEKKKTMVKTLIDVLNENKDQAGTGLYDGSPYLDVPMEKIITTPDGKYEHVTAYGTDAALLFYRNIEDGEWKFFIGAQNTLSCSEYDTDELKAAFAGERCYDDATGSASVVK